MNHAMRQIELTKQTLAILKKNKNLLTFSIINNFISLCLFTAVGIPIYRIESIAWKTNHLSPKMYFIYFGLILLLFSVHHFINILFNAGLTHCAIKKLKGEKYKLAEGFKIMGRFYFTFSAWNILMTTVGCGICVTQYWWDNWPKTKTAKNWLSNLSWVTATFFVTPILLYETRSATQAVRRSAELVKKHWGNVLVSQLNIRMNAWTIHLLSLIPTFIALLIGGKIIIIIGSTITVILFLIIFSVSCTLRLILGAALYLFAKEHDLSAYYDVDLLKNAFRIK